jgi:MoaA/NifB/PqqE/SkfB family radical SAM enzyme
MPARPVMSGTQQSVAVVRHSSVLVGRTLSGGHAKEMKKLRVAKAPRTKRKPKKEADMYINELIFEVTRRCNLACQHCLRGDPQNVDISNETIDKALEGITGIGMITFTGGEPSLAVDRIKYIYEAIKKRDINLGGFYVVTNGKIASRELMNVLTDFYTLVDSCDEYVGSLVISKDQYHVDEGCDTTKADKLYRALTFYRPDDRKGDIRMLINEGRARGMGQREVSLENIIVEMNDEDKPERVESTIYINALGDVVPSCDMSFESQEESKIGNVYDKSLSEIVANAVAVVA